MKNFGRWLSLLGAIALVGCGDSGRTGDGGDGGISLMDGGDDSGSGGDDSGSGGDDAGSGEGDYSSCVESAPDSFPSLPGDSGPYCTDQEDSSPTADCMSACTTGDLPCVNTCAMGDTTDPPPMVGGMAVSCAQCWNNQFAVCMSNNGCHEPLITLDCCGQARCPSGSTSCIESMCSDEAEAFSSCATGSGSVCLTDVTGGDYAVCF